MKNVLRIVVIDLEGKTFSRDWKITANKIDAIRWTIQSEDLPYYIDVDRIYKIEALEISNYTI